MEEPLDDPSEKQSSNSSKNILWIAAATVILVGVVFKFQHWPFAHIILLTGMVLGGIYILIGFKSKL